MIKFGEKCFIYRYAEFVTGKTVFPWVQRYCESISLAWIDPYSVRLDGIKLWASGSNLEVERFFFSIRYGNLSASYLIWWSLMTVYYNQLDQLD